MESVTLRAIQASLEKVNSELKKGNNDISIHLVKTKEERQQASAVVSRAFYTYRLFLWMFADYDEKERKNGIDFIIRLNGSRIWHSGFVLVARNAKKDVCGVTFVELRPRLSRVKAVFAYAMYAFHMFTSIFTFLGSPLWFLARLITNRRLLKRTLAIETGENEHDRVMSDNHLYLLQIATDPDVQSNGIGSILMRTLGQIADEHNLPMYLETDEDRLRHFYERFGFKVVSDYVLEDGEEQFKPNYGMIRDPSQN